MKQDINDIEKLFREGLDNYKAEVDPDIWNNIQNKINQDIPKQDPAPKGEAANAASKGGGGLLSSSSTLITGLIVTAAIVTGGILIFNDNGEKGNKEEKTEVVENGDKTKTFTNNQSQAPEEKKEITSDDVVKQPVSDETQSNIPETENTGSQNKKMFKKPFGEVSIPSDDRYNQGNEQENLVNSEQADNDRDGEKTVSTDEATESRSEVENREIQKSEAVAPMASFEYRVLEKDPQPVVEFKNISNTELVAWDFGDGERSEENGNYISHTYDKPGKYTVKLTAINQVGEKYEAESEIEIFTSSVTLSKSFSPNGDGINDIYKLKDHNDIAEFKGIIYDKSGNEVYTWTDINEGWDGTNKAGVIMPQGNYLFRVIAKGEDGQDLSEGTYFKLFK